MKKIVVFKYIRGVFYLALMMMLVECSAFKKRKPCPCGAGKYFNEATSTVPMDEIIHKMLQVKTSK